MPKVINVCCLLIYSHILSHLQWKSYVMCPRFDSLIFAFFYISRSVLEKKFSLFIKIQLSCLLAISRTCMSLLHKPGPGEITYVLYKYLIFIRFSCRWSQLVPPSPSGSQWRSLSALFLYIPPSSTTRGSVSTQPLDHNTMAPTERQPLRRNDWSSSIHVRLLVVYLLTNKS